MTREERILWYELFKKLPITVKRQYRIENYIVDFYIAEKKLIIEVDGRQHLMSDYKNLDAVRDKKLLEWGIEVIRIPNKDINENFNGICNYLLKRLGFVYSDLKR
ncbi:MAG: DUF559 domain-containing protein [Ruminococcaceae bacterium]|nr:DUF559 domain-containing protein [Oscillospiraceae bacterium]